MEKIIDTLDFLIAVAIFIIATVVPVINNMRKKKKAQGWEEADTDAEEAGSAPAAPAKPAPAAATAVARAPKAGRADDEEWKKTLAERKRREAAAAAAKFSATVNKPDTSVNRLGELPAPSRAAAVLAAPSALEAKNGFIWAEILGPPVSMR
jgi:hypothetical protein